MICASGEGSGALFLSPLLRYEYADLLHSASHRGIPGVVQHRVLASRSPALCIRLGYLLVRTATTVPIPSSDQQVVVVVATTSNALSCTMTSSMSKV